jgi:hypothetical protein
MDGRSRPRIAWSNRLVPQARRLTCQQPIDEVVPTAFDLPLRQGPEVDVLDPSGEGIGDDPGGEQVRRSRDQELATRVRAVEDHLDRQEKAGRPLNLVDDRRHVEVGDETVRVRERRRPEHVVVEVAVAVEEAVVYQRLREGALSDLPRSQDGACAACREHVADLACDSARDQRHAHSLPKSR